MLRSKPNNFIRQTCDYRQQSNANPEARPEGMYRDHHVDDHRDNHHRHQETGSAARMKCRVFLNFSRVERISVLKCEDGLVFGAVILINPADILPQGNTPNEQQEHSDPDEAIVQVENKLLSEHRIDFLQLGRRQKREEFIHHNEE